MKFLKTILVALIVTLLLGFMGCASFQDILTPCHIDEAAIEYSGQEATSYVPWTTIWDAKRIRAYVKFNHLQYQSACDRLKQMDKSKHIFLLDGVDDNIVSSVEFQAKVFNPTGPIGLMVNGLCLGAGAFLIKRPGDKSKKEVELEKSVPA